MSASGERRTNPAITHGRRLHVAKWGLRSIAAAALACGAAGVVDHITAKGPEFGIVAIEMGSRIEAANGSDGNLTPQQASRINELQAAIDTAHDHRDNYWRLGAALFASAAIGAIAHSTASSMERQIPTLPEPQPAE